jgi:hypothetical protein
MLKVNGGDNFGCRAASVPDQNWFACNPDDFLHAEP